MKKKKGWLIALAVVLVVAVLLLLANKILAGDLFGRFGSMLKSVNPDLAPAQETLLATIQGEPYYSSGFSAILQDYQALGNEKDPDAYGKQQVFSELLRREATAQGFSVDPQEAEDYVRQLRDSLSDSPETQAQLEAYRKGRGLSEEEYWDLTTAAYEKMLLTMKLDEALRQEYFSSHSGATAEDFHEYYMTEYRDTLFEKYDVVLVPQK